MHARLSLAAGLLFATGCPGVTFGIAQTPRFQSCKMALPPARPGYPASWPGAPPQCGGGPNISSADVMYQYQKVGKAGPNDRAFQLIDEVGIRYTTQQQCGDTPHPYIFKLAEYMTLPANDVIDYRHCCETKRFAITWGQVAVLDITQLPFPAGALPPVPPGENGAQALDPTKVNRQQADALVADIQIAAGAYWAHVYQYDGCHGQNPVTTCHDVHCLDLAWSDSFNQGTAAFHGSGQ